MENHNTPWRNLEIWLPNALDFNFLIVNNKKTALKEQDMKFTYIGAFKLGTYNLEAIKD